MNEKIDLHFLNNEPIIASSLIVKIDDVNYNHAYFRKHYLEVKLGNNKLRKKFKQVKKLRIFFHVLNNQVPVQMEFGQVIEERIIRYINSSQVKIYHPRFKEIIDDCMIIKCQDVFVDKLDCRQLQENSGEFY